MSYYSDVATWKAQAKASKSQYVIVMVDTFAYDHYALFASSDRQLKEILHEKHGKNMQMAEEVHNIKTGEINYCPHTLVR